jgi:hypothetical protein
VVQVEDVVGVVSILECGEPLQPIRAVRVAQAFFALVGEAVDVDAAGVRLDCRRELTCAAQSRLVLGRAITAGRRSIIAFHTARASS